MHAFVEQRDERVERLEPDSGEALREHVRAQRDDGADRADGKQIADARGMAAQQIELERLELAGGDPDVGERAESGIDAIGRFVASRACVDDCSRGGHALARGVSQRNRFAAVRNCEQLFERERVAIEQDHVR